MKIKLLTALFILVVFASCRKENDDYRDRFVGKYGCNAKAVSYYFDGTYNSDEWDDTIFIAISSDSLIFIKSIYEETPFVAQVYDDGTFSEFRINGHFSKDSLYYKHIVTSSPAGEYYEEYYGKKIR